ncbi:MAG TPA: ribbon-helix-helix domain-containing protein [Alphaproteobacteria bacterium]|nr:ribbon-helix-helix domain-containing protein [Alphaproteobacteria bacterium]
MSAPPQNVRIGPRRTSLRLTPLERQAIADIARRQGLTPTELLGRIEAERGPGRSLSAALRHHLLAFYMDLALKAEAGEQGRYGTR